MACCGSGKKEPLRNLASIDESNSSYMKQVLVLFNRVGPARTGTVDDAVAMVSLYNSIYHQSAGVSSISVLRAYNNLKNEYYRVQRGELVFPPEIDVEPGERYALSCPVVVLDIDGRKAEYRYDGEFYRLRGATVKGFKMKYSGDEMYSLFHRFGDELVLG